MIKIGYIKKIKNYELLPQSKEVQRTKNYLVREWLSDFMCNDVKIIKSKVLKEFINMFSMKWNTTYICIVSRSWVARGMKSVTSPAPITLVFIHSSFQGYIV